MSEVLAHAAEQIAMAMIRAAYKHLPVTVVAGAIAKANTEPIRDIIINVTLSAYEEGRRAGVKRGREELSREMEDDWKPVAERVRRQAGSPSYVDLEYARMVGNPNKTDYPGGPVEVW